MEVEERKKIKDLLVVGMAIGFTAGIIYWIGRWRKWWG